MSKKDEFNEFFDKMETLLRDILQNDYGIDVEGMTQAELKEVIEELIETNEEFMLLSQDIFDDEEDEEFVTEVIYEIDIDDLPDTIKDKINETVKNIQASGYEKNKDVMDKLLDKINEAKEQHDDFSHVLHHLDEKQKWTRLEWDVDTYVQKGDTIVLGYYPIGQLFKVSKHGVEAYHPSFDDLFTEDWYIYEESKKGRR